MKKRGGWSSKLRKGSHTVEAVVVMSMTFLLLEAVFFMCSFWHGRAVMTSAAYEEAYTTRGYEVGGLFGIEEIEKRKAFDEKVHTIQYQANAAALWSGFEKEVRVCAKVRQVLPVRFLWNWKGMQHRSE